MTNRGIDKLIINSPYEEPTEHWLYDRAKQSFNRMEGRRSAGYLIASKDSQSFDDPGYFVPIKSVNKIRERVSNWRENDYPEVTAVTGKLLRHWTNADKSEINRFFFCQLEAIETLIWLTEVGEREAVGIDITNDGGPFRRLCAKMATGTGKTVVMAMAIAWHVLNKVASPQDTRFSKNVLIVAPGLTVKNRLQVLNPSHADDYYSQFNILPPGFSDKLRQGHVLIQNWHKLDWESDDQIAKKRGVDKRGALSDAAYTRQVLGEMAKKKNLLVINDEAHHAWRVPAESKVRGVKKEEINEATKWVGGLDRIHETCGLLACYDFSATPFAPSGKQSSDEALFDWIVSDFGLNDAIESGLVKTPRVAIRDDKVPDAKTYRSRLYHIYNDIEVKADLNARVTAETPLPDLVRNAYYLLGSDWQETRDMWSQTLGVDTPPVMITVANRTETASRVKYSFDHKQINIDELCDPELTLQIDSSVLKKAESGSMKSLGAAKRREEALRAKVDTVGKVGQSGEQIRNVISVGMLSEGWDAKTVTHIMGLRAFSSQLLCEQVVGRGLRRTSYEINEESGLLDPEYVNIFGIPFTFLPHEDDPDEPGGRKPVKPTIEIKPDPDKEQYELRWPNVIRLNSRLEPTLTINWRNVKPLTLDGSTVIESAEIAAVLDAKPDLETLEEKVLHWETIAERTQTVIFHAASQILDQAVESWSGNGSKSDLVCRLIPIVERFVESNLLRFTPSQFERVELLKRGMLTMSLTRVVNHIWEQIQVGSNTVIEPVFNQDFPIASTVDMRPWYTRKPCQPTIKSHINYCVLDSTWEASDAYILDHDPRVLAWVKNDHLGFEIEYRYKGVLRRYIPDFLIKIGDESYLILETKGVETERDRVKQEYLSKWIQAVNAHEGFGTWSAEVSRKPGELKEILDRVLGVD